MLSSSLGHIGSLKYTFRVCRDENDFSRRKTHCGFLRASNFLIMNCISWGWSLYRALAYPLGMKSLIRYTFSRRLAVSR